MLLLAYLMNRSKEWEEAKIRVFAAGFDIESGETVDDLKHTLDEIRIEATPEVVIRPNAEAIAAFSSNATMIFLPFNMRNNVLIDSFGDPIEPLLSRLPMVALAMAAEDIDLDAEPEEGEAGEIASLIDMLKDTERRAKNAENNAKKAAREAEKKREEIESAELSDTDSEMLAQMKEEARKAQLKAEKALRRAAKASLKCEQATEEAEKIGAIDKKDKDITQ